MSDTSFAVLLHANDNTTNHSVISRHPSDSQDVCFELIADDDNRNWTWHEALEKIRFIIEGVVLPMVGAFGLLVNVVVIIVLLYLTKQTTSQKQQNFDHILTSLSIIDCILLFVYIMDSYVQNHHYSNANTYPVEPVWYQVFMLHKVSLMLQM